MAILLNDNLDIAANKPVDNRYGPYATVALAISGIPSFKRHIGLTVGIGLTNTVDYWFKAGTGDTDLIEKVPTVNVPVTSVAGKTGAVTLVKADVGLGNVDNTSDASKPISTLTQTALDAKQATLVSGTTIKTVNGNSLLGAGDIAITGGGGSGNTNLSYTASATGGTVLSDTGSDASLPLVDTTNAGLMSPADKTKLNGIATNANNYTHPNHTGDVTSTGDGATTIGNNVVTNAKLAQIAANTIKGRATTGTGNVEDLTAAQVRTILNVADGATANAAATVAPQPLGTAAVGTATAYARADHVHTLPTASAIGAQATLVSGTNIKSINGTSLLGSGDISIGSGGTQVNSDWDATTGVARILNKPNEFPPIFHGHDITEISSWADYGNTNLAGDIETLDANISSLSDSLTGKEDAWLYPATVTLISSTPDETILSIGGKFTDRSATNTSGVTKNLTLPVTNVITNGLQIIRIADTSTSPILIRRRNWTSSGTGDQYTVLVTATAGQKFTFRSTSTNQNSWVVEAVDTHTHTLASLTQSGAATGQVPKWNGASWVPADDSGGSGGGISLFSYTASPTGGTLTADSLTATISLATTTDAGLLSPTDKQKLDNLGLELTELSVANTNQVTLQKNKHYFVVKTVNGDVDFALPTNNLSSNGDAIIVRLNTPGGATGSVIIGTVGGTPPFQPLASLNSQSRSVKLVYFNQAWRIEYFAKEQIDLSEITNSGATAGQVPKWNGTAWAPADDSGGGGSGNTNLSYTASATGGTVVSDTGNDATLSLADTTNAGLMSPADKTKLNGLTGPYADLVNGKVPESQLPSYVDDVIECATQGTRPQVGQTPGPETGKIYVTLDDNKCWRWTGTTYIEISPSSGQISAVAGLQDALNGKQTTIFNQATIAATANNQTFLVANSYPNNNGADLRRTLTTITFSANVTSGTTIIRLPQWLNTGLGAWRGDQAFFKFQVPSGVTLQFQWHNGTVWVDLAKFNFSGSEYWSAYQATIETGTHVIWNRFSTLYGVRDLFSPRLGNVFLSESEVGPYLEPNNIYNLTTTQPSFYPINLNPGKLGDRIIVRHSGPGNLQFTQNSQTFTAYSGSRTGGAVDNPQIEFLCSLSGGALIWNDVTPNGVVRSVAGKTGNVTLAVGDITQSGATTGQVIKWDGTAWAPATDSGGNALEYVTITPSSSLPYNLLANKQYLVVKSGNDDVDLHLPETANDGDRIIVRWFGGNGGNLRIRRQGGQPGLQTIGTMDVNTGVFYAVWAGIWRAELPAASSALPNSLGVASAGVSNFFSRADHIHSSPAISDLTQGGATTGQVIKWNGTSWAPGDDTGGSGGGMTWSSVPATPTSTGTAGQMSYADNYLYVCVATNVWKRTILATW